MLCVVFIASSAVLHLASLREISKGAVNSDIRVSDFFKQFE